MGSPGPPRPVSTGHLSASCPLPFAFYQFSPLELTPIDSWEMWNNQTKPENDGPGTSSPCVSIAVWITGLNMALFQLWAGLCPKATRSRARYTTPPEQFPPCSTPMLQQGGNSLLARQWGNGTTPAYSLPHHQRGRRQVHSSVYYCAPGPKVQKACVSGGSYSSVQVNVTHWRAPLCPIH